IINSTYAGYSGLFIDGLQSCCAVTGCAGSVSQSDVYTIDVEYITIVCSTSDGDCLSSNLGFIRSHRQTGNASIVQRSSNCFCIVSNIAQINRSSAADSDRFSRCSIVSCSEGDCFVDALIRTQCRGTCVGEFFDTDFLASIRADLEVL